MKMARSLMRPGLFHTDDRDPQPHTACKVAAAASAAVSVRSTRAPSVGGESCASTGLDVGGRTYFQNLVQPDVYCHIASFTTVNLNLQYKVSSNLTLKGSILNLFDRQPPFDVSTYGNAGTQTSYNASLHQAGAIGRFFSLGLNYTF
jgi:iron complex outermembrane receptor protein